MASMSRFVAKDCRLQPHDALYRPTTCLPARKLQTHLFPSRNYQVVCKAATNASGDVPGRAPSGMSQYERIIEMLTTLFPVWVILGTIIGIYKPAAVAWLHTDLFTVGLGFLMLSMGLTLTFEDFRRCLRNPCTVGVGFLAQYLIKPMLGFFIALTLKLSAPLATGLILVSCCPGGQASNVATYISKGNVALSVLMTTCSTIGAIVMTPLLTKLLAGQLVPVDAVGLAITIWGYHMMLNEFFPKFTSKIVTLTPLVGVILTTLLCASPIGQVSDVLKAQGAQLLLPVALLHGAAFAIGYLISKISFGESTSRTISIECGMQSSALGFLLAQKHFTNPLVAVPSAVSVVCMALVGALLLSFGGTTQFPLTTRMISRNEKSFSSCLLLPCCLDCCQFQSIFLQSLASLPSQNLNGFRFVASQEIFSNLLPLRDEISSVGPMRSFWKGGVGHVSVVVNEEDE
ncbi:unnamed protein product [Camellia sinensis]